MQVEYHACLFHAVTLSHLIANKSKQEVQGFSNNLIKKPCLILKLLVCRAYIKLNRNKKEG